MAHIEEVTVVSSQMINCLISHNMVDKLVISKNCIASVMRIFRTLTMFTSNAMKSYDSKIQAEQVYLSAVFTAMYHKIQYNLLILQANPYYDAPGN